jgi:serine phosphatase RsbU (regulator of sigma subunit)
MAWLNEAVLHSDRNLFCTACYATLTASDDGWLVVTTAGGHPLPIVATGDGAAPLGRYGTLLGAFDTIATTTGEARLHSGDVAVFYTDGITDLPPPYGIDAADLADVVESLRALPTADAIAAGIQQSLVARVPDRTRQDDVALLVVRVL